MKGKNLMDKKEVSRHLSKDSVALKALEALGMFSYATEKTCRFMFPVFTVLNPICKARS